MKHHLSLNGVAFFTVLFSFACRTHVTEQGQIELGDKYTNNAFASWQDGDDVFYEWGPQGGTMLVPILKFPATFTAPNEVLSLQFKQTIETDQAELKEEFERFFSTYNTSAPVNEELMTAPIFLQLGRRDLNGATFTIELTAVNPSSQLLRRTVTVHVKGLYQFPGPQCDYLPVNAISCRYRQFQARAQVLPFNDSLDAHADCDLIDLNYRITGLKTENDTACLIAPINTGLMRTDQVFKACLVDSGLNVMDASFDLVYGESFVGTCSPTLIELPVVSSCMRCR